jgi:hypothetical protein
MDFLTEHRSYPICLRIFLMITEQVGKRLSFEGGTNGSRINQLSLSSIVDDEYYYRLLESCVQKVSRELVLCGEDSFFDL